MSKSFRTVLLFILLLLVSSSSLGQDSPKSPAAANVQASAAPGPEAAIAAAAEGLRAKLVEQRRDFHMHPELSNREERTSRVVAERLRKIGFTDIKTGIAQYGIVATLKGGKPGPVIAVRADMDALPVTEVNNVPYKSKNVGVKHACGHDAHTTIELGVAEVLFRMRDQIPGTIKFIFQPAEEGLPPGEVGGAKQMVIEGVLENPRPMAIFGLHVNARTDVGKIEAVSGPMMASSNKFILTIKGKQVHAAYPHEGVDPIVVAAEAITALQTIASRRINPLEPVVVTVGMINGGTRHNIIPNEVKLEGTYRTLSEDVNNRVPALMREILDGVTKSQAATYSLEFSNPNPLTYNDPKLVEETLPVMERVMGKENVIRGRPEMGAEDFSFYQQVIPGFYYRLGVRNESKGITAFQHTPDFDIDEESLVIGTKLMSNVLMDYLQRHAEAKQ
jgi:amidohydrolase